VADAAAAGQHVFGPVKLNQAMLGSRCPHLDCHLLPRLATDDPPQLVDMRDGELLLGDQEYARLAVDLRRELPAEVR
jgi:hypothetical protein